MVGKSSMEVGVRVEAENYLTGEVCHTASAYLTFVALDDKGRPKEVPGLIPETEAEKRRYQEAMMRKKTRHELRKREDNCQNKGICII
jgi:acyl-CoA hydrolase